MRANELRIGNYVEFLGKTKELLYLTKHNGKNETAGYYAGFEKHIPVNFIHLRPIPLTEQWLIDFGFSKSGYGHYRIFKSKKVIVRLWASGSIWMDIKSGAKLKFVHQLQNLYHSITYDELTLNKK